MTVPATIQAGTRVSYEDRANPRRYATVEDVYRDEWGQFARLRWDDGEREPGVPLSSLSTGINKGPGIAGWRVEGPRSEIPDPPKTGDVVSDPGSVWDGAELISVYTRAEAIEDGVLVDVSAAAAEVGIRYPTAMTRAAYEDCVSWPAENGARQDERGRLHDVIWMTRCAIQAAKPGSDRVEVELFRVPNEPGARRSKLTRLVAQVGPGDTAEPVITILRPGED